MGFINLMKKNKTLTAIMVVHLFLGPVLYQALGLIYVFSYKGLDWVRFLSIENNGFYWVLTAVLVFLFWLFKK